MLGTIPFALPWIIVAAFQSAVQTSDFANIQTATHQLEHSGLMGCTAEIEGEKPIINPSKDVVAAAIDRMTPDGGPGFLILTAKNGDFAQTAGGNGAFTVEWREYAHGTFKHWVAGRLADKSSGQIAIATNGFQVTVNSNEKLASAEAKSILLTFCGAQGRPGQFSWRDITDRFQ